MFATWFSACFRAKVRYISDNHHFEASRRGAKIGITSDDKDVFCGCLFDGVCWKTGGKSGRKSEKERDTHRKSVRISLSFFV